MSTDCPQPTRPVSARRRRVARRRQAGCLLFLLILIALAVFVVRLVFFSGNGEADAPHTAENELWITSTAFVYNNQSCRNLDELRQALTDTPPTDTVRLIARDTYPSALALLTELGIPYQ